MRAAAVDRWGGFALDATLPDFTTSPSPTKRSRRLALVAAAALLGAHPAAGEGTVVVLQGLDKVTARVSAIEAPIDVPVRFGTLEIVVRTCHKAPPEKPPESAAFLEISDLRPGEPRVELFSGWMFASSPALSALEHPVYDVWVLDCREGTGSGISEVPLPPSPE